MKPPRGLTDQEAALWARVAKTVTPLDARGRPLLQEEDCAKGREGRPSRLQRPPPRASRQLSVSQPSRQGEDRNSSTPVRHGLDSSWDKKLSRGSIQPDFTLDLHGASLDAAHSRLLHGLAQAKAMGARVVLLVTGKPRPVDAADRTSRRGAIRAKVIDWLAASDHASDIAAIRSAHRRHGGQGAL